MDDATLQRWKIEAFTNPSIPGFGEDWLMTEKAAPVDEIFDSRDIFDLHGSRSTSILDWEIGQIMTPVREAFNAANNGQEVKDISQLLPYATTPEQQAAVQKMILRASADK